MTHFNILLLSLEICTTRNAEKVRSNSAISVILLQRLFAVKRNEMMMTGTRDVNLISMTMIGIVIQTAAEIDTAAGMIGMTVTEIVTVSSKMNFEMMMNILL